MTTNRSGKGAQGTFPDFGGRRRESAAGADEITVLSSTMLSRLSRTIENEIVPRLMMAFDAARPTGLDAGPESADVDLDIDTFVHLLLTEDAPVACEYVKTLRAEGVPLATIYLDLLGPSARRLGEMWEQDECSFTDVTIGVCRMHQVLLDFSRCFELPDSGHENGKRALVVPAPGEQHTFGLFLVVEFLRRAGWHCWTGTPSNTAELYSLVSERRFDAIGLSVSADRNLDRLDEMIGKIRDHSTNPEVKVLVGGYVFAEQADLAQHLGADATARDGAEAVRILNRICKETGSTNGR